MSLPHKDTADSWFRPAWWTVTSAWLHEVLAANGVHRSGPVGVVKVRPWAAVWRVPTDGGALFLKAAAASQWHEPSLSVHLGAMAPQIAPTVLAADASRGVLLTADAGPSLRNLPPSKLSGAMPVIEQALADLATLQRSLAGSDDELLSLGVPDRRPVILRSQLAGLLERSDIRASTDPQTAGEAELNRIRRALPAIDTAAHLLARGPIPMSLDHGDLYLHHILPGPSAVTILDWGDATVTHPFTLLFPLFHQLRTAYAVGPDAALIARLRRAYLAPWAEFGSASQLDDLLDRALVVASLNRALNYVHALGPHAARLTPSLQLMYTRGVTLWLREAMAGLDKLEKR